MQGDSLLEESARRSVVSFRTQQEPKPTGRLRRRNTAAGTGNILIDQRGKVEWSTKAPRSAIISSRLSRLNV
jgi:hypothetical protein